jgi:flavin-dependent dehydrogenase
MTRAHSNRTQGQCDVFVIGGGPAGSTVASLLARRGLDVALAEKERHPRFHIGESLLPVNLELLAQLGVLEQVEAIGIRKYGAELNSPVHDAPVALDFADAWDTSYPFAYQVRRSEFDRILFEHCVVSGVRAMQQCRVTSVAFPPAGGVVIDTSSPLKVEQRWRARYVIDASGRDTFLARRLGTKQRNLRHASAALYGHFSGAQRLPGNAEGNISLFWFDHGWFWFIPLQDGTTSIGVVCKPDYLRNRGRDPNRFLLDTIGLCPALAARIGDARLIGDATATGNYSYVSRRMADDRYMLIGDAYAFVDPVLSSGVFLAMQGAFIGADVVEACLREPHSAKRHLRRYEKAVRHGLGHFSWFVYRMTRPAMRKLLMAPRNNLRIREALLALLAGDLYRGTPIYHSLLAFKVIYYITSMFLIKQSVSAWRDDRAALKANAQTQTSSY